MAPHDPLFKGLLRAFFPSFLRLVAPELAVRLELTVAVFLDKELTLGAPPGGSRVVDLLARVPVRNGNGRALLIHVEVEARARRGMGERLREYHRWIRTRHPEQVLSIVLYLRGGQGGIREESLRGDVMGPGLSDFRYLAFGLEKCPAADHLASPEPLAWALAALMDPGGWSRAELKRNCLLKIAGTPLRDTERQELVNCIETYVQLSPEEAEELARLGIPERGRGKTMLYKITWADKMMLEGERQGARKVLLSMIEQRFGGVPDEIRHRIEEIRSLDRLQRLARRVLTAKSLRGLRLH